MMTISVIVEGKPTESLMILRIGAALPSNIRRALRTAGLMLKRQIQQNLSGPAHKKFTYWDAGSRSQRLAAAGGDSISRIKSSNRRLSGSRYSATSNANPYPGVVTGKLRASVTSVLDPDGQSVRIAPHTAYAAIHEFGGMAGRNHATPIPARPYVAPARDMLKDAILEMFRKELLGGAAI